MKKFLSMLTVIAILSTSVIGCDGDKDKAKKDAPAKDAPAKEAKAKDAPK